MRSMARGAPRQSAVKIETANVHDDNLDKACTDDLRRCLQSRGSENAGQASERIYGSMCEIIDRVGAESAISSLQCIADNETPPLLALAGEALRRACMRHAGQVFGAAYEAHFRLIPLVVRGGSPAQFPAEIDRFSVLRIFDLLKRALNQSGIDGALVHAMPLAYSYTMNEFANENLTRVQVILREAMMGCARHSPESAPKFIVAPFDGDRAKRTDDELYDLKLPGVGLQGWFDESHNVSAGDRAVDRLHQGHWITMRLIPVVILVPRGKEPPVIDGFGELTSRIGQMLTFASVPREGVARLRSAREDPDVSITPLGVYGVADGPTVARLAIGRERILSGILRALPRIDGRQAVVNVEFEPNVALLNLFITLGDEEVIPVSQVSMPQGMIAQQFIESLACKLSEMGIASKISTNDPMLRMGDMVSLVLH